MQSTRTLRLPVPVTVIAAIAAVTSLGPAPGDTRNLTRLAGLPSMTAPAEVTGEARPVPAWIEWCRRVPSDCAVNTSEAAKVALSPEIWRVLITVNRTVNRKIEPAKDQILMGVPDSWDLPTGGYGDCEDFALLKRRLLVEAGLPRRALRMTVVIDETGEGHAVLMVRTDRGDLVLDNKADVILPWFSTGYVFVKREGHDGMRWVSLGGARQPTVMARR